MKEIPNVECLEDTMCESLSGTSGVREIWAAPVPRDRAIIGISGRMRSETQVFGMQSKSQDRAQETTNA